MATDYGVDINEDIDSVDFYEIRIEEGRDYWQVMLDRERLLEVMDNEQKREYGKCF